MANTPATIKFSSQPDKGAGNLDVFHRNAAIREGYLRMPGNYHVYLPDGKKQVKYPRQATAGWYDTRSAARKI